MGRKEQLSKKLFRQQEILNAAKAESRELSAEEKREFDSLQGEINQLQEEQQQNEPPTGSVKEQQRAIEDERARTLEITELQRQFGIDLTEHIGKGTSIEEVRKLVIESMKRTNEPSHVGHQVDEIEKVRAAAADSIILRAGLTVEKPAEGAKEMMGMSLRDIAAETLVRSGEYSMEQIFRMSHEDMFQTMQRQFFNPTAAFPSILDETIKKSYVQGYEKVETTFQEWTSKGTLKDFKALQTSEYVAGSAGLFERVPENGELKHDTPIDHKLPSRKLETFGRQFSMSRQAFINDDIGFLTTIPSRYAAAAKETINSQVYSILYNNPAIYDGTALFSTTHQNLIGSGTAVTAQAIQKAILAMQMQKDHEGKAIRIKPGTIIVPVGYAFDITAIFESPTINTDDNTQAKNPLYNYKYPINIVEEPELNALAGSNASPWFLTCTKNSAKTIQVDYLNGNEIPTIVRSQVPGVLGYVWDIYLDWGVTVLDYRGLVKNPGVPINFTL